ncbi:MAG: pirin family protein [Gemmataceae bacterium]|nr:pirin family protein [Gemmataceae bacterium]
MIRIRKASQRGRTAIDWLDSLHTFSFGDYHDPAHMSFRSLRVMNEDWIKPGAGFGMHPHRDMEIVTYVLEGALDHKDSLGSGGSLRPGEVQYMSAGTGIRHSEFNPSASEPVHLYQIWLLPEQRGLPPAYEQRSFPAAERRGRFQVVASPDGRDNSLRIRQAAELSLAVLDAGAPIHHPLRPGGHAWLQMLRGTATVNGQTVSAGDGVALSDEINVTVQAAQPSEVLLFDLA